MELDELQKVERVLVVGRFDEAAGIEAHVSYPLTTAHLASAGTSRLGERFRRLRAPFPQARLDR